MDVDDATLQNSLAFFGLSDAQKQKRKTKQKNSAMRKDGIGEDEKHLYVKAVEKYGNNWRQIFHYILSNGSKSLPQAVYAKYEAASNDEAKLKSLRSRINNIGRKMKDSPVVRSREEVNVIKTSDCTVQEMAVRMQHAKTLEAQDPLNGTNDSDDSDLETATANETPGTSTTTKMSAEQFVDSDSDDDVGRKAAKPLKRAAKPKAKSKMEGLIEKASKMMEVAEKAAKAHHSYIKGIAANNYVDLDSD